MRTRIAGWVAGGLCALWVSCAHAQEKKAPLAACIEPVALRTETSQALPGSKLTVVCPAREDELGLSRLTAEEFKATGLTPEQFLREAAATAAAHFKALKPDIHRDGKGRAEYAVLKSESHLTASVILCPEFHARFKETFGDKLVVLVPDRFTVYVFARGFGQFQEMGPEILEKHAGSTWPCSREAFEITAEGLKCLGAFETGDEE
jgi:hypothetical protein